MDAKPKVEASWLGDIKITLAPPRTLRPAHSGISNIKQNPSSLRYTLIDRHLVASTVSISPRWPVRILDRSDWKVFAEQTTDLRGRIKELLTAQSE
jgi:hypothetical protein